MNPKNQPPEDPHSPAATLPLPEMVEESSFLRQILFERRFRIAVALFLSLVVFLTLFLPKWWVTTPEGFTPVIHVSGLDKVQSWSLRRSARSYGEASQWDDAVHAWRMAIAEDPCNPENGRGLVRLLIGSPKPLTGHVRFGIQQGLWLLRLGGTNRIDLRLVSELFDRYQLDEGVTAMLGSRWETLESSDSVLLLKALFHEGQMDRFDALWKLHPEHATNVLMRVYRAAWQVGWGPPSQIQEGRDLMEKAKGDPALSTTAHALQLAISRVRQDPETYASSLKFLEREHVDRVIDHAAHWLLLLQLGRRAEVEPLLKAFVKPPATVRDCLAVAQIHAMLGQFREASDYIGRYAPTLGTNLELWVRRSEYLIAASDWDRLKDVAVEIRQTEGLRDSISGFGWYLEGLAELRHNRNTTADQAFASMLKATLADPFLGFRTAKGLAELGRPALARELLDRLEKDFGNTAEYWLQVELAAYAVDDIDTMLEAAQKAYALEPAHPTIINNYAAALIIMRQRPAEAVKLTLNKLASHSNDVGAQINHALALLQNGRLNEAQAVLTPIDARQLPGLHHSVYQLARFELLAAQGDKRGALQAAGLVEVRYLKGPQVRWLESAVAKLKAGG